MKTLIISVFLLTAILNQAIASPTTPDTVKTSMEKISSKEQDIQSRIQGAFSMSFNAQDNANLTSIIEELSSSYNEYKNSLLLYWEAYAHFHNSIYYLENSDKRNAEIEVNKGIDILESIEDKNSEDYTLLSMLQSFSCQFLSYPKVVKVSNDAKKNIKKAIELDENNLRACYVLANNDFYTPEGFGGGKKVEQYALKAITLPTQKIKDPFLPSWGKQSSFELLTNYYVKHNEFDKAEKYVDMGLKEFPQSSVLKSNRTKCDNVK